MFVWASNAFSIPIYTYTITDNILAQKGHSRSSSTGGWVDTIPDITNSEFDITEIVVTYNPGGNSLAFDLYTNYNNEGYEHTYFADLALDLNKDGVYEYAIVFSSHIGRTNEQRSSSGVGTGVYSIQSGYKEDYHYYNPTYSVTPAYTKGWNTSSYFYEGESLGNYYYGEKWDRDAPKLPIVAVGGSPTRLGNIVSSLDGPASDYPLYHWNIGIDSSLICYTGGSMDIFWAGATCANDVIYGKVPPISEPGTLLLLGTGLIGIAGYGKIRLRRRKK
jgi:hypothetical protein